MRKKLLAMLAVSAFALGSASAFADLGEDMDTLAENRRRRAESGAE